MVKLSWLALWLAFSVLILWAIFYVVGWVLAGFIADPAE